MSHEALFVWAFALALALFFPIRKLIWVVRVRRAMRVREVDEAEKERLKRGAGFAAAGIALVFSLLYMVTLFGQRP